MRPGTVVGLILKLARRAALAAAAVVAGCGARTELRHGERAEDAGVDASAAADARDVARVNCEEAGATYIYVISMENELMRFYPPLRSFDSIGTIACPATFGSAPSSMAVDRWGIAYVLFDDGELFRVSTLTASCQPTAFAIGQQGFSVMFGMGFASNTNDEGETLFVAGDYIGTSLATIDPQTFELRVLGPIRDHIGRLALTGTDEARLYGFAAPQQGSPMAGHLLEIDKSTGAALGTQVFDMRAIDTVASACAFWGGDFYFFTSEARGRSRVYRFLFDPLPEFITEIDVTIVGAGVSTCAPAK